MKKLLIALVLLSSVAHAQQLTLKVGQTIFLGNKQTESFSVAPFTTAKGTNESHLVWVGALSHVSSLPEIIITLKGNIVTIQNYAIFGYAGATDYTKNSKLEVEVADVSPGSVTLKLVEYYESPLFGKGTAEGKIILLYSGKALNISNTALLNSTYEPNQKKEVGGWGTY